MINFCSDTGPLIEIVYILTSHLYVYKNHNLCRLHDTIYISRGIYLRFRPPTVYKFEMFKTIVSLIHLIPHLFKLAGTYNISLNQDIISKHDISICFIEHILR